MRIYEGHTLLSVLKQLLWESFTVAFIDTLNKILLCRLSADTELCTRRGLRKGKDLPFKIITLGKSY